MTSVNPEGKTTTFTGVTSGGWSARVAAQGQGAQVRRGHAAESRVAYMPRATFEWLLDTDIGFNRFLLMQLNERSTPSR